MIMYILYIIYDYILLMIMYVHIIIICKPTQYYKLSSVDTNGKGDCM